MNYELEFCNSSYEWISRSVECFGAGHSPDLASPSVETVPAQRGGVSRRSPLSSTPPGPPFVQKSGHLGAVAPTETVLGTIVNTVTCRSS